jgi:hypothetical protein
LHNIDKYRNYCDQCHDEYKRSEFIKGDPKSKRLNMLNNILSMIGNCASIAFAIGFIMLFGSKRMLGIWATSIGFAVILLCILLSFVIDHAINKRIVELKADVKLRPIFWETGE